MDWIRHFDFLDHWDFDFLVDGYFFNVMMMNCMHMIWNIDLDMTILKRKEREMKFIGNHRMILMLIHTITTRSLCRVCFSLLLLSRSLSNELAPFIKICKIREGEERRKNSLSAVCTVMILLAIVMLN